MRGPAAAEMQDMAQADLRRVERAARKSRSARQELRQAILLAREAGETFEDIGGAAGLSRQRVSQIVSGKE
jgi:DNA-directed RNA polymerase sigma subunit (sigma70/sigma32)